MGLVKQQGTTKAKVNPKDFQTLKKQYLADIQTKSTWKMFLLILLSTSGLKYVPMSNWTMEHKGIKRVEIALSNGKRQITCIALFSCTLSSKFLTLQVIYVGKTPACLPKVKFPNGQNVTFTQNYWSNEETMMMYLDSILLPYVEKTCAELQLNFNHRALVIFDQFKAETTDNSNQFYIQ